MLISGDDSNVVITLSTCFSMFCLHSHPFPLPDDWQKCNSSVDGETHGNRRWNSISANVVASSPSFSRLAARAPRRVCSQAKLWLRPSASHSETPCSGSPVEYAPWFASFEKPLNGYVIRLKGNLKRTSGNSLSPYGRGWGENKQGSWCCTTHS